MRKSIVLLLSILGLNSIQAQSIFDTYQNNEDVTYVSISPKMFQLLGRMTVSSADEEAQEFIEMVSSITTFKVLISGNASIAEEMQTWVDQAAKNKSLENLMDIRENEAEVSFYAEQDEKTQKVKQLLMFSKGKIPMNNSEVQLNGKTIESVLLLLEGNIDLDQIAALTEKMDLPGGDQLKKVSEK